MGSGRDALASTDTLLVLDLVVRVNIVTQSD